MTLIFATPERLFAKGWGFSRRLLRLNGSGRLFPVGTVAVPRPVIIVISEIVDHLFFPPKMLKIL